MTGDDYGDCDDCDDCDDKDALLEHRDYEDLGVVPCPPTARGAFGHPMRLHAREEDVRAMVVAM